MRVLSDLETISEDADLWGGKAVALSKLIKNGYNVPIGFVISSEAYLSYYLNKKDNSDFIYELNRWINKYFKNCDIILRSSANIENDGEFAACGVFESVIHRANSDLWQDLSCVWESVGSEYAKSYYKTVGLDVNKVKMSVIVQKYEIKQHSAVIQSFDFIKNKNQIVIEYTDGLNSIVDGKNDAKSFTIDSHGTIVDGEICEDFSDEILGVIISDIKRAESIFGSHIEIEAQIDSKSITYLQARKIFSEDSNK